MGQKQQRSANSGEEGLAGLVLAKPSFGMTQTMILRPVLEWHSSHGILGTKTQQETALDN